MENKSFWGPAISGMLLSAVLLLALASPGGAGSAPDFTLKDVLSGQAYTLSQLRGKVVMLNFFTYHLRTLQERDALSPTDRSGV